MSPEVVDDIDRAFAELYRAEFDGQVRRAWLMLGSGERAHEVVQDAFAALYQRWPTISDPGAYLNRSVLNGCRTQGRQGSREPLVELEPDPAPFGGDAVELAELLSGLPFVQRAVVVLKFYGGFTETEIAELVGIRPGSVGPAATRALRKLRSVLP